MAAPADGWFGVLRDALVPRTLLLVPSVDNCGLTAIDARTVALCAAVVLPLRLLLDAAVLRPFARRMVLSPAMRRLERVPEKKAETVLRFQESAWKLVVYATFQIAGWYALMSEAADAGVGEWDAADLDAGTAARVQKGVRTFFWDGWPEQECGAATKNLYAAELGFYLASIGMLIFWDKRKKDHNVMLAHHVVTSLLLVHSWALHFLRVGLVILLLHDASDVLMESAKLFNYAGHAVGANTFFALFALSWIALRLLLFPFVVVRSTLFDTMRMFRAPPFELHIVEPGPVLFVHHGAYNVALLALCVMHVYWFGLIAQMAHRAIVGPAAASRLEGGTRTPAGVQGDIREM